MGVRRARNQAAEVGQGAGARLARGQRRGAAQRHEAGAGKAAARAAAGSVPAGAGDAGLCAPDVDGASSRRLGLPVERGGAVEIAPHLFQHFLHRTSANHFRGQGSQEN